MKAENGSFLERKQRFLREEGALLTKASRKRTTKP
jgi:hypothetical protein